MLVINVPELENFDRKSNKFVKAEGYTLQLEHSLASLSKWESEFERPFLSKGPATGDETLAYVRCMNNGDDVSVNDLRRLTDEHLHLIAEHINKKMTATWFADNTPQGRGREVVTAETIYFWMTTYQIPFECENWHLNKLLALIRMASIKHTPAKNRPRSKPSDLAEQRRKLNAERKAAANTTG